MLRIGGETYVVKHHGSVRYENDRSYTFTARLEKAKMRKNDQRPTSCFERIAKLNGSLLTLSEVGHNDIVGIMNQDFICNTKDKSIPADLSADRTQLISSFIDQLQSRGIHPAHFHIKINDALSFSGEEADVTAKHVQQVMQWKYKE